jgi:hypothetical protein
MMFVRSDASEPRIVACRFALSIPKDVMGEAAALA